MICMKRRTRQALFWIAVIIFGFASWIAVKYAQGYVYDFMLHQFVRTGALSVTVNTSSTLFIDGKEIGGTSLLGNTVGKRGMKPGSYTVELVRDGYTSWKKTAVVLDGMLTNFPSVLILPTDADNIVELKREASKSLAESLTIRDAPVPIKKGTVAELRIGDILLRGTQLFDMRTASGSLIADHVLGMTPTDNGNRILWWTQSQLWVYWLRSTDYQPFRVEKEKELVSRFSTPIKRAGWFHDLDHIVIDLGGNSYRILEIDLRGGLNTIKL